MLADLAVELAVVGRFFILCEHRLEIPAERTCIRDVFRLLHGVPWRCGLPRREPSVPKRRKRERMKE
jgi:hypothetical protein